MNAFDREIRLIGEEKLHILQQKHVAVFGLGGVGGACAEALVRGGIGHLDLFDGDKVDETNLNRQAFSLHSTIGMPKTQAAQCRLLDINPALSLTLFPVFYSADNAAQFPFDGYDFVLDCIDQVSAKLLIAENAQKAGTPLLSCMGTGNKLDPSRFKISAIEKTSVCPLCRIMRRECKARGLSHLNVLWSDEQPVHIGQSTPASISFVPPAAGLMMAGYALRYLGGF